MCIFENATVKSNCPMQENYEIFKDFTGHYQSFFFRPPDPKSEKKNLEDLKVLRRSPDLLNNVKIGQG